MKNKTDMNARGGRVRGKLAKAAVAAVVMGSAFVPAASAMASDVGLPWWERPRIEQPTEKKITNDLGDKRPADGEDEDAPEIECEEFGVRWEPFRGLVFACLDD